MALTKNKLKKIIKETILKEELSAEERFVVFKEHLNKLNKYLDDIKKEDVGKMTIKTLANKVRLLLNDLGEK